MDHKKSGFVAIIGKPNSGKSTLINQLAKNKIAIATPKKNTTRNQIDFIYNDEESQIIFSDTPGFLKVNNILDEKMVEIIRRSIKNVDIALFIIKVYDNIDDEYLKKIELVGSNIKKFLLINKIDLLENKAELLDKINNFQNTKLFDEIIPISALKNINIDTLLKVIKSNLKEDVQYYPEDQSVNYSDEFYISEIIREKILFNFDDEIPHEVFIKITDLVKDSKILKIRAEIIVSRESIKGMIIGKDGQAIRKIGTQARGELERKFGKKIFLELFVKIRKNWKNKESIIKDI